MTNETPSNGTTQSLTFAKYIDQQIQGNRRLLPRVNGLAEKLAKEPAEGERIDTSSDVLAAIKTLDPEKSDEWYGKTAAIVEAVMEVMQNLDPKKVETAVAYDMERLFQDFSNASRASAGR